MMAGGWIDHSTKTVPEAALLTLFEIVGELAL